MSPAERFFGEEFRPLGASAPGAGVATVPALDTTSLESNGHGVGESNLLSNVPTLEELERVHIRFVLERVRWHQGRAAAVLGISSKTLYRKIRQYGFQRPSSQAKNNEGTGHRR